MNFLFFLTISDLWNKIKPFDYKLFSKINGDWHSAFLDSVIPYTREAYLWIPFYIFLALFAILNFKRTGWFWVLFFIANVALSDFISSHIIKEYISRVRPCRDPMLADHIRFLVKSCPVNSSFTSSHAVNHFAAAMFIFSTFKKISKWWALIFVWAFIPSYAQVYVGIHFPLDVLCGMLVGILLGYLVAKLFNNKIGIFYNETGLVI
ncbi:MAG: phosphatase PAP2 family protein [Chitinophagaceae bacterium]|nr:phosphatase PAP2 family protein [Chitinophagaceae bacterium]